MGLRQVDKRMSSKCILGGTGRSGKKKVNRKRRTPREVNHEGFNGPGNNLLSPSTDYHRPWMLNGRVRNGNGCDHPGMLTGSLEPPVTEAYINKVTVELRLANSQEERDGGKDQCGEAIGS